MRIKRRKTRVVRVGKVKIGGDNPVVIQSMAKIKTRDTAAVIEQIKELKKAGCQIMRIAIKDFADASALKIIKRNSSLPLVADIHFNWRLALAAIDNGADKIRLNPGNIDKESQIKEVVRALKAAHIPLRIGLNSGSVKDEGRSNCAMADKLVNSCMRYIKRIERLKFHDIVISVKANNVMDTLEAYRKISKLCDYPLHLGVTATGSAYNGIIKSSIALGSLLLEGIGDTIRVSLTESPTEEVRVARCILESLGLANPGAQIISCPTCGRCEVDLAKLVKELEEKLRTTDYGLRTKPLKIAIMGCVVNGPGEAKEADIGVAFGGSEGLLFKRGKPVKKVAFKDCAKILLKEMGRVDE